MANNINKLKLLSLFSGIGAFEKALTRQDIPYELVNYCEIDKYATKAYSLIHNVDENLNLGDAKKINEKKIPDFDLLTYGFPCQDISVSGRQKGINKNTRSGLLFEALRILKYKNPKYSICENVKNLVGKRFIKDFNRLLEDLEGFGYNNYWQVLNAKYYGVPQNRERVFIVSIKKDIDNNTFKFPEGFDSGARLKDFIETDVDLKYYLSDKELKYMDRKTKDGRNHWDFKHHHDLEEDYASCIVANTYKGVPYNVLRGYSLGDEGGCEFIRKLTPLECFRLMGFDDEDYHILKNNKISNTQMYKMAGNSIVVNVLEGIFASLLK